MFEWTARKCQIYFKVIPIITFCKNWAKSYIKDQDGNNKGLESIMRIAIRYEEP